MLLYAKTSSERASKGQGGNRYIHLIINDEAKKVIYERITIPHPEGYLVIEPQEKCAMVQKRHGGGYHFKNKRSIKLTYPHLILAYKKYARIIIAVVNSLIYITYTFF